VPGHGVLAGKNGGVSVMAAVELVGIWVNKLRTKNGTRRFEKHIVDENGDVVAYVYVFDDYNIGFGRSIKQVGVWSHYLDANNVILPKITRYNMDEVREELGKYFAPKLVDKVLEIASKFFERWG
jgi:hypothetical protein